ncbi:MAG: HAD family hydrolase, partial [Mycobacterium sp.]
MGKLEPVLIDPRRHDAVLFALDAVMTDTALDSTVTLVRQLQEIGVGTAVFSSNPGCRNVLTPAGLGDLFAVCVDGPVSARALVELADRLAVRPGRCVVVGTDAADVATAREGGFALVIGVD